MAPSPTAKQELDAHRASYEALLRRHAAWAVVDARAPPELNAMVSRVHRAERRRLRRRRCQPADECQCPITLESVSQLKHPVVMSDGFVYEQEAVYNWLARNGTSPLTRDPFQAWGVPLAKARAAVDRATQGEL